MNDSIRSDGLPITVSAHWPRPSVCLVRLAGVRFLASAGVGVLMSAARNRDGIRGRLHVVGVRDNPAVSHVLELTGVRRHLDIHESLDRLLADLDRG